MSEQEQPRRQTKCLEEGQVMAWHDGALSRSEADEVVDHLATCARCAALERALLSDRRRVFALLSGVDPRPDATPKPAAALAHFRERLALMHAGTEHPANPPDVDDDHQPARPAPNRTAEAERGTLLPTAPPAARPRRPRMWVQGLVAAATIAVLLGSVLLARTWLPSTGTQPSPGSLNLSTSQVKFGPHPAAPQQVQVQLSNFASNAQVLLTRDVQEALQITPNAQGPALVKVGADGEAQATIIVTPDWGSGPHTIHAVNIKSRFTASAGLLVIGATHSQPAQLQVTSSGSPATPLTSLDLGSGIQGSNTTRAVYLKNTSQSGSITWSASSNQSWLLISPSSGMFNQGQTIEVAIQRGTLPPGRYAGVIKFFSNVGPVPPVNVTMAVTPLPPGTSVMAVSPAALSFVTTDGSAAPPCQTLTIGNPGSSPLSWSLTMSSSPGAAASGSWLVASPSSGRILASSYQVVWVCAQSTAVLPGAYLGRLQITAPGAADSSQTVSVSLTVQPHCSLTTSASFLNFTTVQGVTGVRRQGLGLNATTSCNGNPVPWTAQVSTPNWLSVSPRSGQIEGTASANLTISVNPAGLRPQPQPYSGFLVFSAQNGTQTVLVQLVVTQPPPGAPIMGASPLNLNFSSTQGQPGPSGQVVTITNSGGSPLHWSSSAEPITTASWLTISPTSGQVLPGKTGMATITVDTSGLPPGAYTGQVTLNGAGTAQGSSQVISVNLVVQPPCTLTQPSLSSLAFTGVQGGPNPVWQSVLVTGTGNCSWPLLIAPSIPSGANWLTVNTPAGSTIRGDGQSASLVIAPDIGQLSASSTPYTAMVTLTATDRMGIPVQGSGQTIAVSLTVEPPCTFVPLSSPTLAFRMFLGETLSTAQSVPLSEQGTCARPISYQVSPSPGVPWLVTTAPASDGGSGSALQVSVNATGLAPGTYSAAITITASDTNNTAVSGSLAINVSLTITTPTVSGTVLACTGAPACLSPDQPIPGATVTVLSGTTTVATITADASGNYTMNTVPVGMYTLNVSGTLQGANYSAHGIPLDITGDIAGLNVNAY